VLAQAKRDKAMNDLLDAISNIYDFVNSSGRIQYPGPVRLTLLEKLASETMDCAYFIQYHAMAQNFCECTVQVFCLCNALDFVFQGHVQ
jgi:hypothetical protein